MSRHRSRFARAWLVAWHDLLDLGRQRGTWFGLMLLPAVNVVLILLVPGYLAEREQQRDEAATFTIAVQASEADERAVARILDDPALRVVATADARRAVTSRAAHAGLVAEAGAADAIAGGDEAQIRVIALSTRRASNIAFGRLVDVLERTRIELAIDRADAAAIPHRAVQPLVMKPVDLADTSRGARLELAQLVPVLVLLPLTGSVGLAAQRISGARDARVFEPLLLLPVSRSELLAGKALSGLVLGAVTLPAAVVPLFVGRVAPVGAAGRTATLSLGTVLAIGVIAAALLTVLVAIGAFAGSAARTSTELASLLPLVSVPILLLAVTIRFFPELHPDGVIAAVPILGPSLVVRDLAAGAATSLAGPIAVATSILWAVALLLPAGRLLGKERSVLRATG